MDGDSFTFEYHPAAIHQGAGVVARIESELGEYGCSRALIVTDEALAGVDVVMDPVREGIGDGLVGTYDGVTPEKYLQSAHEAAERVVAEDVDALVPVGGGSSLDIAKITSVLLGHDRPLEDVAAEMVETESVIVPDEDVELLDIFAVPTTLPGAELSQVAGVELTLDPAGKSLAEIPHGGVGDRRLMPTGVFHDADLFETTPEHILAASAMNGFDKGIEMLYTRHHNPLTDATAAKGVGLLAEHLPAITDDATDRADLLGMLNGIALAQYGLSTPRAYRASVIHSFGHALSRNYPVQQGAAHAIAAPHALRYIFEKIDGRRDLLAEALGVADENASAAETAEAVASAVADVRDALELPDQLRDVEGAEKEHFPDLARAVIEDPFMDAGPRDLDARQDEIEAVFEQMW